MSGFNGFPADLRKFLAELEANNRRDWFEPNKARFEASVREPALAFIREMGLRLEAISPYLNAIDKKVGGSLMRPYRDTRFSADKTPYKTNVGIHFQHESVGDVHAPGFYVHLEAKEVFLGAGTWRPESTDLLGIRTRIANQPEAWSEAVHGGAFVAEWRLGGESLTRVPRGFDPNHPHAVDLRRKDFIAIRNFEPADIERADFIDRVVESFATASPLMRFLCQTNGMNW